MKMMKKYAVLVAALMVGLLFNSQAFALGYVDPLLLSISLSRL